MVCKADVVDLVLKALNLQHLGLVVAEVLEELLGRGLGFLDIAVASGNVSGQGDRVGKGLSYGFKPLAPGHVGMVPQVLHIASVKVLSAVAQLPLGKGIEVRESLYFLAMHVLCGLFLFRADVGSELDVHDESEDADAELAKILVVEAHIQIVRDALVDVVETQPARRHLLASIGTFFSPRLTDPLSFSCCLSFWNFSLGGFCGSAPKFRSSTNSIFSLSSSGKLSSSRRNTTTSSKSISSSALLAATTVVSDQECLA